MDSEKDDNNENSSPATTSRSRPNEVTLSAGRLDVEVQGYADEEALMELASEQMQEQMRKWVEVDRQVVSTNPDAIFSFRGDL